jgi:hypothetical protein
LGNLHSRLDNNIEATYSSCRKLNARIDLHAVRASTLKASSFKKSPFGRFSGHWVTTLQCAKLIFPEAVMAGSAASFRRISVKTQGFCVALLLLAFMLGSNSAKAQVLYGSITGTVTDQSGAVVPNAIITLTN